jgi:hypothetical protein
MSKITAQMISDEAATSCKHAVLDSVSRCENKKGDIKSELAAILNAAIAAGLVSPPVYIIRDAFDDIPIKFGSAITLFSDPSYADKWQRSEHWKGQAE